MFVTLVVVNLAKPESNNVYIFYLKTRYKSYETFTLYKYNDVHE